MLQTLLHNAQLLIVLAFVLLSLLGGIFRKVQEQREKQRVRTAQERARLEMLRTGRGVRERDPADAPEPVVFQAGPAPMGPPTSAAEALARLEEIARRRQEQMGKVRNSGQPQQRRASEPTGPVIVMGPQGPIVIRPGQNVPGAGVPATGRKPKQQRQPKQPKQQARPAPEPVAPPQAYTVIEHARAAAASTPAQVGGRVGPVLPSVTPRTPAEWRRLAAANAIFGRPVGEQQPGGDGGPGRLF